MKIFIIEDNQDLVFGYKIMMDFNNIEVLDVSNDGVDAINKFKCFKHKPDIILLDHRMPGKNGLEIMKEILECDKYAKIIFVSGDLTIKEKALASGAKSFLTKPVKEETILKEIYRVYNTDI